MDLNSKLIWVHLRIIFFCSCCFSEHVAANLFECTSNRTRVKRESLKWACVLDKAYVRSLRAVFAIGFDDHLGNVYFFRTQVVHLSCGYPKSLYNPSTDIKDLNCSETISLSVPDWKQRLNWFKKLIFSSIMCHTHTHINEFPAAKRNWQQQISWYEIKINWLLQIITTLMATILKIPHNS